MLGSLSRASGWEGPSCGLRICVLSIGVAPAPDWSFKATVPELTLPSSIPGKHASPTLLAPGLPVLCRHPALQSHNGLSSSGSSRTSLPGWYLVSFLAKLLGLLLPRTTHSGNKSQTLKPERCSESSNFKRRFLYKRIPFTSKKIVQVVIPQAHGGRGAE